VLLPSGTLDLAHPSLPAAGGKPQNVLQRCRGGL